MNHYLSVSRRQWNVRLNVWQSYSHRNNDMCNANFSTKNQKATFQLSSYSNCCPLSPTCVLSFRRHWLTALSTTLCFSSTLTEMRCCA